MSPLFVRRCRSQPTSSSGNGGGIVLERVIVVVGFVLVLACMWWLGLPAALS